MKFKPCIAILSDNKLFRKNRRCNHIFGEINGKKAVGSDCIKIYFSVWNIRFYDNSAQSTSLFRDNWQFGFKSPELFVNIIIIIGIYIAFGKNEPWKFPWNRRSKAQTDNSAVVPDCRISVKFIPVFYSVFHFGAFYNFNTESRWNHIRTNHSEPPFLHFLSKI